MRMLDYFILMSKKTSNKKPKNAITNEKVDIVSMFNLEKIKELKRLDKLR